MPGAAAMMAAVAAAPTPIGARNQLIEKWIMETCATCGHPELAGRLSYEISDAPFFNDHGGYATTVWGEGGQVASGVLQFSLVYWTLPRQLNAYRRNLVIHETCHVLANHVAGRDVQHEEPWRRLMHLCGQPPWTNVFTP
jgi:hypothetical protein